MVSHSCVVYSPIASTSPTHVVSGKRSKPSMSHSLYLEVDAANTPLTKHFKSQQRGKATIIRTSRSQALKRATCCSLDAVYE